MRASSDRVALGTAFDARVINENIPYKWIGGNRDQLHYLLHIMILR